MSSPHYCQPCEREDTCVPAVRFCSECQETLCKECDRFHKKSKATSNHHVIDISQVKDFSTLPERYCPKHPEMILDLVCVDHDEICCKQCMTESHRECPNLLPLDVASRDIRASQLLTDTMKDLDAVVDAFQSIYTAIEKEILSIDDQKKIASKDIDKFKEQLHAHIDHLAKLEHGNLETICQEQSQVLKKRKAEVLKSRQTFEEYKDNLQTMIACGSKDQLYCLAHQHKLSVSKGETLAIEIGGDMKKLEVTFMEKRQLITSFTSLGEIFKTSTTLLIPLKFQNAQAANIDQDTNDVEKKLYYDSKFDFNSRISLSIRGIAFTTDDKLMLCDYNSQDVLLYTADGNYVNRLTMQNNPFGIHILSKSKEAVVTLPNTSSIEFIDINLLRSVKIVSTSSAPWGITSIDDSLVVGSYGVIIFFTLDGTHLKNVDLIGTDSIAPCYMVPVDKTRLHISCHSFYTISDSGKVLNKYSTDCRLHGICIDKSGLPYVASDNRITRLTVDGQVLNDNILDDKENYGTISGIVFNTKRTKLYAATHNGTSLTVFDFK